VTSQRQDRYLRLIHLRNRMITAEDTTRRTPGLANVGMSGQTDRRRLPESGLRDRRPVVGSILNQRHMTARPVWARAYHRWRLQTRQHILFSDESRFSLRLCDGRYRVYRRRDNARCHVARVCQDFFNQNYIRVLPWPALLPDLSPIEHLWDELVIRVRHRQIPPETLPELRDALVHE